MADGGLKKRRRANSGGPRPPVAEASIGDGDAAARLLELQRSAGNQAVLRMLRSAAGTYPRCRLQRMQLAAVSPGEREADPIILMNIKHGLTVNARRKVPNDRIAALGDDYSGDDLHLPSEKNRKENEVVFIHGHGAPGIFLGNMALKPGGEVDAQLFQDAADVVAQKLRKVSDQKKKGRPYEIRVTSCHGADESSPFALSLVTSLKKALVDAPHEITIKGLEKEGFSYPGFKSHQPSDDSWETAYRRLLKGPMDEFKAWAGKDGREADYAERFSKLETLLPEKVIKAFIEEIRMAGVYSKRDLKPDDPRLKTFVKVLNKTI